MSFSSSYSLWAFLEQHAVCIPLIQRDYAQGREGEEYTALRKRFLANLMDAFKPRREEPLVLDFVYGSLSADKSVFYPLDGQQRLTTLWLLHWFLAFRGRLDEKQRESVSARLKQFSYQTRHSSRQFCEDMCNLIQAEAQEAAVSTIKGQKWFYSFSEQDPTINSMIRMLNHIEAIWNAKQYDSNKATDWFQRLTGDGASPIVFLKQTHVNSQTLTDDLYVKMNARGKPLTSFENFKADMLSYLETHEIRLGNQKDPKTSLAFLMDTRWTNLFWTFKYESAQSCDIDTSMMAFFKRYFLCWHLAHPITGTDSASGKDDVIIQLEAEQEEYSGFDSFEAILRQDGQACMEGLYDCLNSLDTLCQGKDKNFFFSLFSPSWGKGDEFALIPTYTGRKDENTDRLTLHPLTAKLRPVFWATCVYLMKRHGALNECHMKNWLRFVWNMAENSVSDAGDAAALIGFLMQLSSEESVLDDICSYWGKAESHQGVTASLDSSRDTLQDILGYEHWASMRQLHEEIIKARKQFRDYRHRLRKWKEDIEWKDVIAKAEDIGFLHGSIAVLIMDENGELSDKGWEYFEKVKYDWAKDSISDTRLKTDDLKKFERNLRCFFSRRSGDLIASNYRIREVFIPAASVWRDERFNKLELSKKEDNKRAVLRYKYADSIHKLLCGEKEYKDIDAQKEHYNKLFGDESVVHEYLTWWKEKKQRNDYEKIIISWESNGLMTLRWNGWRHESESIVLNHRDRDARVLKLIGDPLKDKLLYGTVNNTTYLWGLAIPFKYQEQHLRWETHGKQDFIYLVNEKWEKLIRDSNALDEDLDKRYYRVAVNCANKDDSYWQMLIGKLVAQRLTPVP